jgi:hypothetical protein
MRNDEVQDLITQLNRLHLQQAELFARLEKAIGKEEAQTREDAHGIEVEQTREFVIAHGVAQTVEFAIGRQGHSKEPEPFQANPGKITKIGNKRITLTTQSGSKILRATKNLVLQQP